MTKIIAIDPGTVNLSYAIMENEEIVDFGIVNLLHLVVKKKQTDYPYMVKAWIDNTKVFDRVDKVVIENQMQARMKMVACAIRCFFFDKAIMVSPKAVRNRFNISHSDYRKNKKASISFIGPYLKGELKKRFENTKKKDDIADACIMCFFALNKKM